MAMEGNQAKLEGLVPRQYQEEVFSRAQKGNIIAALDTGSGKTLISLLLIKWIASLEKSSGKTIVFLVPKVTLVEQQHAFIQRNSSLRVGKLHGAQELDLSDRTGWRKRIENCDVLVMTAQIFLNILTHSLWKMEKVALMIFDECHHARKNHPYNGILREYGHCPATHRPKIFGMTASPIWNVKDPLGSLAVLEANLDAKVTAVREHVQELAMYSHKALEMVKEYPAPPEIFQGYPSPTIYECLKVVDQKTWDHLDIPWTNIEIRYQVTLNNLGPYCASMFLYLEMQHHVARVIAETKTKLLEVSDDAMSVDDVDASSSQAPKEPPQELFLVIDVLLDFQKFFPADASTLTIPIPVPLEWCTPKVKVLVDMLVTYVTRFPAFQCIIFVEQRQVASSLSKLLPAIPELKDKISCGFLVGSGVNSDGVSTQTNRHYGDPVRLFRDRKINILIATSVAEEGLDFQECDLVVRFDALHHMVGYVQSRGRARKAGSTFVIMIQEHDTAQLEKYQKLQMKEPEVNQVYRTRHMDLDHAEDEEDSDSEEETDPADLLARERYVVPSTGATLTYDNSLNLLNHLCSLIPRDAFTQAHKPRYTGAFEATVHLPRALPVSSSDLTFTGPVRRSKREAKRAAAYKAVKRLRELDVFDEYLLPTCRDTGDDIIDQPGGATSARNVPEIMTVPVCDPWCIGDKLWLHPLAVDDEITTGLVTGTSLPLCEVKVNGCQVQILPGKVLDFEEDLEREQRASMHEYTKLGVNLGITAKGLTGPLSLYLVPIKPDYQPDFDKIEKLLNNPKGIYDWSQITLADNDRLLVRFAYRTGSTYLLRNVRQDLSPMSLLAFQQEPPQSGSQTYHDYWTQKYSKKNLRVMMPTDGPLLEVTRLVRSKMGTYSLYTDKVADPVLLAADYIFPQKSCSWLPMSYSVRRVYEILPALCHRLTDIYRATCAVRELKLPLIPTNLVIESLTIPSASMPFNNQRLETLGDAVLQLCTTVHLLNQYPNRHEGQLSTLRQQHVSNKYLLRRALDVGLDRFVNSERPSVDKWRYCLPQDQASDMDDAVQQNVRTVMRAYPRRNLQDCMEALLGASFVAGGISLALHTGTTLGLDFGGLTPWFMRYRQTCKAGPIAALFTDLEKTLGYTFRHNHLVLESLTHPSFTNSEVPSYQRLEFLGDAIIELVVTKYLYDKFPNATSHQLSRPRQAAICSPTLAHLTVARLGLHKMMLVNSMELSRAMNVYVPLLERFSAEDVAKAWWKLDPPKALSDVFESVIGAVLVDTGYDYDKTAAVVEYVMEDVLKALSPTPQKDPVSELTEWMAGSGCLSLNFKECARETGLYAQEGVVVLVHDNLVAGPIVSASQYVAKFAAAERALAILKDPKSEKSLSNLCTCTKHMDGNLSPTISTLKGFSMLKIDSAPAEPSDVEDEAEVAAILNATD